MIPNIGGPELVIVLVVLLLLFGAGRTASIVRSVGGGIREFRNLGRLDQRDEKPEEDREPTALEAVEDEKVRGTR